MKALFTDLDNTLIYSYKHDIGPQKVLVETKEGKELSYMTRGSHTCLMELRKKMQIIPVTTRSVQQYKRIVFHKAWTVEKALVANGGVLLLNGVADEEWYRESLERIASAEVQLHRGISLLQEDKSVCFEVRKVDGLYVFSKSENPAKTLANLRKQLDLQLVSVLQNSSKVYIIPKGLNKGDAIVRLQKKFAFDECYAAGDSEFDIPMLEKADYALYPEGLSIGAVSDSIRLAIPRNQLFSDALLQYISTTV